MKYSLNVIHTLQPAPDYGSFLCWTMQEENAVIDTSFIKAREFMEMQKFGLLITCIRSLSCNLSFNTHPIIYMFFTDKAY